MRDSCFSLGQISFSGIFAEAEVFLDIKREPFPESREEPEILSGSVRG